MGNLKRSVLISVSLAAVLMVASTIEAQTPHVASVLPQQNQLDVAMSSSISVTFDVGMNPATLTSSSFVVHASISGSHSGSISYNSLTRTATLAPSTPFLTGEVVTAILTLGIQSAGGVPMARSYTWSFTIQATSGTGQFANHVDYDSGDSTYGLAAGDFTGDGRLDIVATSSASAFIGVLPALAGGGYGFGMNYGVGTRPMDVCFGDLDRDGDLDIAVANEGSSTVSVLKNNGTGLVVSNVQYMTGTGPRAICVADFNGDGNLDLATGNSIGNTVTILLNLGSGTFTAIGPFAAGGIPYDIASADFNNDGAMDIVTANWSGGGVCAELLNLGLGNLAGPIMVGYGGAIGVYPADVNHDGWIDLVEAGNGPDAALVTINPGNGIFPANADAAFPVRGYPNAIVAADFERDGDLDIATASSWQTSGLSVTTLRNNGTGAFGGRVDDTVDFGPFNIIAADFNSDGSIDLATANITNGTVSVLLNSCCIGTTGNVNVSGIVDLADLSALVSYLTGGGYVLPCVGEANVNAVGIVDLSDLSSLVSYLTGGGYVLPSCP